MFCLNLFTIDAFTGGGGGGDSVFHARRNFDVEFYSRNFIGVFCSRSLGQNENSGSEIFVVFIQQICVHSYWR